MTTEYHEEHGRLLAEIDGVKYYQNYVSGASFGWEISVAYVQFGQEYNYDTGQWTDTTSVGGGVDALSFNVNEDGDIITSSGISYGMASVALVRNPDGSHNLVGALGLDHPLASANIYLSLSEDRPNGSSLHTYNTLWVEEDGTIHKTEFVRNNHGATGGEGVVALVTKIAPDGTKSTDKFDVPEYKALEMIEGTAPRSWLNDQCFPAGTQVEMADGSLLPIEDVRASDWVMAFDPATMEKLPRQVTKLFRGETTEWVELNFEVDGEASTLTATPGHPFLTRDGSFAPIAELVNDQGQAEIVLRDGAVVMAEAQMVSYSAETAQMYEQSYAVATAGNVALAPSPKNAWTTYNFEVEGTHTYIAEQVCVHNRCQELTISERHFNALVEAGIIEEHGLIGVRMPDGQYALFHPEDGVANPDTFGADVPISHLIEVIGDYVNHVGHSIESVLDDTPQYLVDALPGLFAALVSGQDFEEAIEAYGANIVANMGIDTLARIFGLERLEELDFPRDPDTDQMLIPDTLDPKFFETEIGSAIKGALVSAAVMHILTDDEITAEDLQHLALNHSVRFVVTQALQTQNWATVGNVTEKFTDWFGFEEAAVNLTPAAQAGAAAAVALLVDFIDGGFEDFGQALGGAAAAAGTSYLTSAITNTKFVVAIGEGIAEALSISFNAVAPIIGAIVGAVIGKIFGKLFTPPPPMFNVVENDDGTTTVYITKESGGYVYAATNGEDILVGHSGDDALIGSAGDNELHGQDGDDYLDGRAGDDLITGGKGDDEAHGGRGDDRVIGGRGDDIVNGGAGNDLVIGGDGDDTLYGDRAQDYRDADHDQRDSVSNRGNQGTSNGSTSGSNSDPNTSTNDEVSTSDPDATHNDVLLAGAGNDQAFAGKGDDFVNGSFGDDILMGQAGDDVVMGGEHNDYIDGGVGNDVLDGEAGSDTIHGGAGDDVIHGDKMVVLKDTEVTTAIRRWLEKLGTGEISDVYKDTYTVEKEVFNKDLFLNGSVNIDRAGSISDAFMVTETVTKTQKMSLKETLGISHVYKSITNLNSAPFAGAFTLGDLLLTKVSSVEGSLIGGLEGNDSIIFEAFMEWLETADSALKLAIEDGAYDYLASDYVAPVDDPDTDEDEAEGNPGQLMFTLRGGNDDISAGAGDDVAYGGFGHDTLRGGDGDDILYGDGLGNGTDDDGNTIIQNVGAGNDKIYGGAGNDQITAGDGNNIVDGGDGDDRIFAGSGNDQIHGGSGADIIVSGDGDDLIYAGDSGVPDEDDQTASHQDIVNAGAGNDIVYGEGGEDYISGGTGNDVLDGGEGDDNLSGDDGHDELRGGDGNDVLSGGEGDDQLDGGTGDDKLFGGEGHDAIVAGGGNDIVQAGLGDDQIDGGLGNDTLLGEIGADTISGGDGDDLLSGGTDNDILSGDAGDDELLGGSGDDQLSGGIGNDIIHGDSSTAAEHGSDHIDAGEGDDIVFAGGGEDTVFAGTGNDDVKAGNGDDVVHGGNGDDILAGEAGNDHLEGGEGNDHLKGGSGQDVLIAGNGDDALEGGVDDDTLVSGRGTQVLNGGEGNDLYQVDLAGLRGTIEDASGLDKIELSSHFEPKDILLEKDGDDLLLRSRANPDDHVRIVDQFAGSPKIEVVSFASHDFTLDLTNVILGTDGDDAIEGTENNDIVLALAGDDVVIGAGGDDLLDGGPGKDVLFGNEGNDLVHGSSEDDFLNGGSGDDLINDGIGSDMLVGGEGNDTFALTQNAGDQDIIADFEQGEDSISLTNFGDQFVSLKQMKYFRADFAFDGSDSLLTFASGQSVSIEDVNYEALSEGDFIFNLREITELTGTELNEIIIGGDGDDVINGGEGFDILTGGDGADTFVISQKAGVIDQITDFDVAKDVVDLSAFSDNSSVHQFEVVQRGADVTISFGNDQHLILENAQKADLTLDNFKFDLFEDQANVDRFAGEIAYDFAQDDVFETDSEVLGSDVEKTADTLEDQIDGSAGSGESGSAAMSYGTKPVGAGSIFSNAGFHGGFDKTFENNAYYKTKFFGLIKGGLVKPKEFNSSYQGRRVVVENAGVEYPDAYNGSGDDKMYGAYWAEIIKSFGGDDAIYARGGNDTVYAGDGKDYVEGGDGADTIHGGSGADALHGNAGHDKLNGDKGNDKLWGGTGNDELRGGNGYDQLWGQDGNDKLWGQDGNDKLFGGSGADFLYGGIGNDTVYGGTGNDTINGQLGHDVLHGANGNDKIIGDRGNDYITGGDGDDFLSGWGDNDFLHGGNDDDEIHGGSGNDHAVGGNGNDTLFGDSGSDLLQGGAGNDKLYGGVWMDLLEGGYGDDYLNGGTGNDTLLGEQGNDELHGGEGADLLRGGDGNDELFGNLHNDTLDGGGGDDTLNGGDGKDTLLAGSGDDKAHGGLGNDHISGDDGDDQISGDEGDDYLKGGAGNDRILGGEGSDVLNGGLGDDYLEGGAGSDVIIGETGLNFIHGGSGADVVVGGDDNDTIYGGSGSDLLGGNDGSDYIDGGTNDDSIFGGQGHDRLVGGQGNDLLDGGEGDDLLQGGLDNDLINGGAGKDLLEGGAGQDELHGGDHNDILKGEDGIDLLVGGNGADRLFGGADADILIGGAGADLLYGGEGADVFNYDALTESTASYLDVIADFDRNEDKIDLSGLDIAFEDLEITIVNGETDISIDGTDFKLRILGEDHDLTAAQFNL